MNHFEPALSWAQGKPCGLTWVEHNSKSKGCSGFTLWHWDFRHFCLLQQFYNSGLVPGWPQRFYMLARPGLFPQQMKGFNSKSTSLFVPLTPVMLRIQAYSLCSMSFWHHWCVLKPPTSIFLYLLQSTAVGFFMDLCIPECALNLLQLETSRSSAVHCFLLMIALVFSIQKLIASISVSLKNIIATRQLMCFCVFGISPLSVSQCRA